MRILYVITKSNWGGAQKHVYDLALAMKQKGHEVAVALGGDGILRKRLEDAGIYTHSIAKMSRDVSVGNDAGSFFSILSVIRHRRPDVLHLHSPKAGGLGALAGQIMRVPKIIYTVHGWAFNENRPPHEKILITFFSWLTSLLVHKLILICNRDYAQAIRFPLIKGRPVLIPIGIKLPIFVSVDGSKQTISKAINLPIPDLNKKTLIGTIAELHPNKGLHYLIEAMSEVVKKHPQAVSVIISDGQMKSELHMRIKELNLEQNVYLAGYLEHAAEYLKAFSFFVLPSIKEGLPYVIMEAGAASLPVVSTTVGGIPDIVDDMHSGILVLPKKSHELAHAIEFMLEHPAEVKKYGAALKEKVAKEFSVEKMVEGVHKLYSN